MRESSLRKHVLDRLSPSEAHLPPGARSWARVIWPSWSPGPVLELRDPNSGQDPDPAEKPRYQYVVQRERLWRRHLRPAPLADIDNEDRWGDEPYAPEPRTASAWELVAPAATRKGMFALPNPSALPWEWAMEQGVTQYEYYVEPIRVEGEWCVRSPGVQTEGYLMPMTHPFNPWADITDVPCPVCGSMVRWDEAGYVPGHRKCESGHQFLWDRSGVFVRCA